MARADAEIEASFRITDADLVIGRLFDREVILGRLDQKQKQRAEPSAGTARPTRRRSPRASASCVTLVLLWG